MRHAGHPNMALIFDLALHNGVAPVAGKRFGPETGDAHSFKNFDELWQAYKKQAEFVVTRLNVMLHAAHHIDEERLRVPLWSVFSPGCMENGQDFITGGQYSYNTWSF